MLRKLYQKALLAGFVGSFYATVLATGVVILCDSMQEWIVKRVKP